MIVLATVLPLPVVWFNALKLRGDRNGDK